MIPTCSSCSFFSQMTKECRANPPAALVAQGNPGEIKLVGYWPPTTAENWCGQHSGLFKNQLLVVAASVDQVSPSVPPEENN